MSLAQVRRKNLAFPEVFQSVLHGSTLAQIVLPKEIQSVLDAILNVLQIILTFLVAYLVVLWLTLCFWTFRDIQARTRDIFAQIFATLLVLFFNIPGILIYRLVRPKETLSEAYERSLQEEYMLQDLEERDICPVCRVKVQSEFNFCFNCRTRLRRECPSCGYAIKMKWTNCPNCGTPTKTRAREAVMQAAGLGAARPPQPTAPPTPRPAPNTREIVPAIEPEAGLYQPPPAYPTQPHQPQGNQRPRQNPTASLRQQYNQEGDAPADAGRNPGVVEQPEPSNYYLDEPTRPNSGYPPSSRNNPPNNRNPRSNPTDSEQNQV